MTPSFGQMGLLFPRSTKKKNQDAAVQSCFATGPPAQLSAQRALRHSRPWRNGSEKRAQGGQTENSELRNGAGDAPNQEMVVNPRKRAGKDKESREARETTPTTGTTRSTEKLTLLLCFALGTLEKAASSNQFCASHGHTYERSRNQTWMCVCVCV